MLNESENFTWGRVSLLFPEFWKDTPSKKMNYSPEFKNGSMSFLFNSDYNIQIFLKQLIPEWIPQDKTKINGKLIEEYYRDLSKKVYEEVKTQLDLSFEILESWREFIYKLERGIWTGSLLDHLDFNQNPKKNVSLYDYFSLSPERNNLITRKLLKVRELPEDSLTNKWLKYAKLSYYIENPNNETSCPKIIGESISDCVKRANEIYKVAEEIESLEI